MLRETSQYPGNHNEPTENQPINLTGEQLASENAAFLSETIYNNHKRERIASFDKTWRAQWHNTGFREVFNSIETDSPFEKYSSKGWKIHVSFQKGQERAMAFFLYTHGLYFKVEGGSGTAFNGNTESGATIYIGAFDTMKEIVQFIESKANSILLPSIGSVGNIDVSPRIKARFDVQKTPYGTREGGTAKYSDYGLPWPQLGGIPMLRKFDKREEEIRASWTQKTDDEKRRAYQEVQAMYEESKKEAIKDFGEEFLLGLGSTN